MLGLRELPHSKVAVDLAFAGAFRGWEYADLFPQVRTDLRTLDGVRVLSRATVTKRTLLLYWDSDKWLTIRQRIDDWVPEGEDAEFGASVVDERIPAEAWQDLARGLVERLNK